MYTQLLARKVVLDAEGKELAESVAAGVARIGALLDGLQIFAVRGFAGAPQPVDLNDVVANALHNLGHAIAISATVVTVGLLPRVRSNAQLLERVLQNLIANAIKYRSQAPALIHVSASRLGPDWVLRVEDNGVGIAPAYHEKIFELLKRLHGPEIPGSGIGLATCRKIVEGLGGVIWVESEEQLGSAFCFTISANDGDEHKSLVAPERPSANTPIQLVKRASNRPQPIPETI